MTSEILDELHLIIISIMSGAWLMIVYDILRIFRLFVPHGVWWTGVEDLGYWIYVAFYTFLMLCREHDGIPRFYIIAGVCLGMTVYDRIFSQKLLKALKNGVEYIKMKLSK